jgi:hypothetical protein
MSVEGYVIPYLAGLFDGEGCVHIGWCGGFFRMSLNVGNCDRRVLEMFMEQFGGSIYVSKNNRRRRKTGQWTITSNDADKAARILRKYCVVKQEQLDHFIDTREILDLTQGKRITPAQREGREYAISRLKEIRWNGVYDVG